MSKKDPWYCQCKYETVAGERKRVGVSWIPEKLAIVGKKIYFGEKHEANREMWVVLEVWGRKPESWLMERRMDFKNQRRMSDV